MLQDLNAVVHLVLDDIYLDINFSYWAAGRFGGSGGFAYMRAEPPAAPVTNGDYNGNFVVDAADYTVWRDTFGEEVELGSGADGFADGTIDDNDYDFWKERFGNVISWAAAAAAVAVPEPANWLLLLAGLLIMATKRKISPRGPGHNSMKRVGDFSCSRWRFTRRVRRCWACAAEPAGTRGCFISGNSENSLPTPMVPSSSSNCSIASNGRNGRHRRTAPLAFHRQDVYVSSVIFPARRPTKFLLVATAGSAACLVE